MPSDPHHECVEQESCQMRNRNISGWINLGWNQNGFWYIKCWRFFSHFRTYEECLTVRKHVNGPFILDENISDIQTIAKAWQDHAADVVNIKISKFGGITRAKQATEFCSSVGIAMTVEDTWGGNQCILKDISKVIATISRKSSPNLQIPDSDQLVFLRTRWHSDSGHPPPGIVSASETAVLSNRLQFLQHRQEWEICQPPNRWSAHRKRAEDDRS